MEAKIIKIITNAIKAGIEPLTDFGKTQKEQKTARRIAKHDLQREIGFKMIDADRFSHTEIIEMLNAL